MGLYTRCQSDEPGQIISRDAQEPPRVSARRCLRARASRLAFTRTGTPRNVPICQTSQIRKLACDCGELARARVICRAGNQDRRESQWQRRRSVPIPLG